MASRTTIEIYTRHRIRLSSGVAASLIICPRCGIEVPMISLADAAAILQLTRDAIARLCSGGTLHAGATTSGAPLICCNSLVALTDNSTPEIQDRLL